MSDTHGFHEQEPLEPVDILIHAGDATNYYNWQKNVAEWNHFFKWFVDYPAEYKIYVPGNHDTYLYHVKCQVDLPEKMYILNHQFIEIKGLKIFGSPYTPDFNDWAFMVDRVRMEYVWEDLPEGLDFLITHGPPYSILDSVDDAQPVGCEALLNKVKEIKPRFHVFGHVHDNGRNGNNGEVYNGTTRFINASQVKDEEFDRGLVYKGKVIEINYPITH